VTQALIQVNGVTGSNDDLPINTLVQLNNVNNGGESTFNWTIVDQPPGTADNLSNATIQNPTLTPKKEGSYRLKLVVNQGLSDQATNTVIVGIRSLKTRERLIAVGETTEDSLTVGWGEAQRSWMRRLDNLYNSEFGIVVGVAGVGGLTRGTVVRPSGISTIKTGLPGQETVMSFISAPSTAAANVNGPLFILLGGVDGSSSPANGALIRCLFLGMYGTVASAGNVGDIVYVNDSALISNVAGTNPRKIGKIIDNTGGNLTIIFAGSLVQAA
jgi:hypothetical protein